MNNFQKKILVIGRGEISKYLKDFDKEIFTISHSESLIKNSDFYRNFDIVINATFDMEIFKVDYDLYNSYDYEILKKIPDNTKYLFLSSRKVYLPKLNICENDSSFKLNIDTYGKNKLLIENIIKEKCKGQYIILRLPNIFGKYSIGKNNFFGVAFNSYLSIRKVYLNTSKQTFKDFIYGNDLAAMIFDICHTDFSGICNLSYCDKYPLDHFLNNTINKYNDMLIIDDDNFNDQFTLNTDIFKSLVGKNYNPNFNSIKKEIFNYL